MTRKLYKVFFTHERRALCHGLRSCTVSRSYRSNPPYLPLASKTDNLPSKHRCNSCPRSSVHRRHGQDLAPLLPLQLSTYDTVDARADGITRLVEKNAGVVVKLDLRPVAAEHRVLGSDDDGVADVSALDLLGVGDAGHTGGGGGAVLLDDDDDAVT